MKDPILLIQTAFAGDLVLTLPLLDDLAERHPEAPIDVLCIPSTAALLQGHPRIRRTIAYDKRRRRPSLPSLMRTLSREGYGLCVSPHRSLRSALLARATRAPRRIAFDRSAGRLLFTETVPYRDDLHEVDRNRSLLWQETSLQPAPRRPRLYPSATDEAAARDLVTSLGGTASRPVICIAPGSVWATKRWTEDGFAETAAHFGRSALVLLIGGAEDRALCERIRTRAVAIAESGGVPVTISSVAGELGFLASAALIATAAVLVSNDSAPVHLASAMGTPVVEIYGATVPAFGFSPYGVPHRIVQMEGLACRPCAIHGGTSCPIGTFVCMRNLAAARVIDAAEVLLAGTGTEGTQ